MDINKIAVGIDFSAESEAALRAAIVLARHFGASIEMIHVTYVYEVDDVSSNYADIFREHQERVRARFEELRERYAGQGVELSQSLVNGRPTSELPRAAEEHEAELLVVGTHGYTGLKRFFLGSVAESALRHSNTDVLVVRGDGEIRFDRLMVPTDFSPCSERALAVASELASEGAEIELFHCWQVPEPVESYTVEQAMLADIRADIESNARKRGDALLERFEREGVTTTYASAEAPAKVGIADHAEGFDLIVIGTHGRRGLRRLLLGSVAAATVRHAPCSVLVARAEPDE